MRISFVGCGAAGLPLAMAWRRAGHEIGAIHARTSAEAIVAALGAGSPRAPLHDSDVVVFATPDDALAEVARAHPLSPGQVALHLSGFHPSTVLAPTGARTAGLHPLRAFAEPQASLEALRGTWCFVEGEAAATAERLARDFGAKVARVATERKALYHAAAALASNYSVTLLAIARDLFGSAGIGEREARAALASLVAGSVENVAKVGLPQSLTGPVARGDWRVVEAHLSALPPPVRRLYAELLRATIPLALAKGGLSPEAAVALAKLAEGAR